MSWIYIQLDNAHPKSFYSACIGYGRNGPWYFNGRWFAHVQKSQISVRDTDKTEQDRIYSSADGAAWTNDAYLQIQSRTSDVFDETNGFIYVVTVFANATQIQIDRFNCSTRAFDLHRESPFSYDYRYPVLNVKVCQRSTQELVIAYTVSEYSGLFGSKNSVWWVTYNPVTDEWGTPTGAYTEPLKQIELAQLYCYSDIVNFFVLRSTSYLIFDDLLHRGMSSSNVFDAVQNVCSVGTFDLGIGNAETWNGDIALPIVIGDYTAPKLITGSIAGSTSPTWTTDTVSSTTVPARGYFAPTVACAVNGTDLHYYFVQWPSDVIQLWECTNSGSGWSTDAKFFENEWSNPYDDFAHAPNVIFRSGKAYALLDRIWPYYDQIYWEHYSITLAIWPKRGNKGAYFGKPFGSGGAGYFL